ncbi:MAG: TIGR03621 family F420-dependent LLM class oxidoreductase [Actinomycetia bacterium]|nr:TIGR03621 family F420-dependent LLM class oxidoreductase [Actinomycetes bacterium]
MTDNHPFRFGIQASRATSLSEWTEIARKVEDLGYSTLTMADHFDDHLAIGPALATAAAATSHLRLGTVVFCNDFRHPAMLAKEVATLDLLSEGRIEFGLGAGWMTADYEGTGLTLDRPGVRIERMLESLEICRGLFGSDPVNFEGDHYTITDLTGSPQPVQPGGPPILIGGGGPRMLRLAGRHADIVGINFNLNPGVFSPDLGVDAVPERADQKIAWVKEGASDRWGDLEVQVRIHLAVITDDREGTAAALGPAFGLTVDEALGTPFALVGTAEQIADDLIARRERWGISYVTVGLESLDDFAPVVDLISGR